MLRGIFFRWSSYSSAICHRKFQRLRLPTMSLDHFREHIYIYMNYAWLAWVWCERYAKEWNARSRDHVKRFTSGSFPLIFLSLSPRGLSILHSSSYCCRNYFKNCMVRAVKWENIRTSDVRPNCDITTDTFFLYIQRFYKFPSRWYRISNFLRWCVHSCIL